MSLSCTFACVSNEAAQIRYAVSAQDSVGKSSSTTVYQIEARQQKPRTNILSWMPKFVRIARNADAIADLAKYTEAKRWFIADPAQRVRREPDVIIRSRHGKKLRPETVRSISAIPTVKNGRVFGIKSLGMLCPKPAAMRGSPQQVAQRTERSQTSGAGHP